MRVFMIVLALVLACAAAALAQNETSSGNNQSSSSQPSMSSSSTGDQMVDACVSRCMSISQQQINAMRAQGLSNSDIAMAAAISMRSGQPLSAVVNQWQSTKNWSQVASHFNVSISDLASAPAAASSPDAESFNTAFVSQYYSIPQSQIRSLRQQGYSWEDINLMANAALRTGQPISQIASLRSQGLSWADIATRYNVACNTLVSPVPATCVMTSPVGAGPVAQPCAPRTPCPIINLPCAIYDIRGRIILSQDQALNYYANGYDWLDVAVAANIARYTGMPIFQVLTDMRGMGSWWNLIYEYSVPPSVAFNVADYPFPQNSIYSSKVAEANMKAIQKYQRAGVYPPCTYPPPAICSPCSSCQPTTVPGQGPAVCPCNPVPTMTPPATCPPGTVPTLTPTCPPGTVPTGTGPVTGQPYTQTTPSGTTVTQPSSAPY